MMKRTQRILATLILVAMMFALPANFVYAEGNVIDTLVVLPAKDYNEKEAAAMKERLGHIPAFVLQALNDKGVKIKLTSNKITDEPELNYLKGVTPRGWEGTGLTWDDVPGVSEKVVVVRIGYSKKGKGHNSQNLELHETMHAVDRFAFNTVSATNEFKKVFDQEANVKYKNDGYVSVYTTEYFAETACLYLFDDKTREQLKKDMPLTYDFMDKLFNP